MSRLVKPSTPQLWDQRVDEMGLSIAGSPIEPLVQTLYAELAAKAVTFRPPVYVANEWGCPDGVPLIGVPFYLVEPRLHSLEEAYADDLEDAERILIGLRHEAGHAVNYAYRLYEDPEWQALFGDFFAEYGDDYRPHPWSRRFVRHLPGWYAQKHPDEDFAETFAVWMTPGLDWRARYQGWGALEKLEYVDRIMQRLGSQPPTYDMSTVAPPDPDELAFTVGELYELRTEEDLPPVEQLDERLDHDLASIFTAEGLGRDASLLVWEHRQSIMRSVSDFAGSRMFVVKAILDTLVGRVRALGLRAQPGSEFDAIIRTTALVSTLVHTYLERGQLLPDARPVAEVVTEVAAAAAQAADLATAELAAELAAEFEEVETTGEHPASATPAAGPANSNVRAA